MWYGASLFGGKMPNTTKPIRTLPSVQEIEPSRLFCNTIVEERAVGAPTASGAGIWLVDRNMGVVWMNEMMEEIYGPLEKLKGKQCYSGFRGRTSKCPDCLPTKAFETGNIVTGFISRKTRDGIQRYYHLIEAPMMDDNNQVSRVMEIVLDVTENTRLEEALQASESEYRALFDHAGTAVVETDDQGTLVRVNQLFEELSGYKKNEIEGKAHYLQFVHPKERERIELFDRQRALDPKKAPDSYEFVFLNRWGAERLVQILVSSIPDSGHQISSLIDITEKWQLEQEVRSKNQFLANILRHSVDGIIALDPGDVIRSFNHGAEMIFGFKAKEVLGKKFSSLLAPKARRNRKMKEMAEQFGRDGYLRNYIVEAVAKDGRPLSINITRTAIRDDNGAELGSSAIVRDITEAQRTEQRMIQREKTLALGELAATLAHEIKNPLNSMVINMEMCKNHFTDLPAEKRKTLSKYVDIFSSEIRRLNEVMQGVLDFAKPMEGTFQRVKLQYIIAHVVELVSGQATREGITVKFECAPELPEIEGVPDYLKQILINLVLNAFQAMPKGGKLLIAAENAGPGKVQISVTDTGVGIPRRNFSKIFDLYFSTKEKGSGLGLPLVKRLVITHGGTISVKSRFKHGSTFIITFPSIA